jgi:hypothetical protein
MSKLITLNGIDNSELLEDMLSGDLVIFEDIQGSKIWVNIDGDKLRIKAKSLSNDDINIIDLAIQNYYNKAIEFFNSLDKRVKSLLNKKWWFCFEYFPDEQPANISYNKTPKNNLVLSAISKVRKVKFSIDELEEYSRLFDVDMQPIIFQGQLTDRMIEAIKYFINTSEEDLEYIFDEKSFAYFFYKILNPSKESSFLMENDFQENLEKILIKCKDKEFSLQLLNPLYTRMSDVNKTEFVEVYTLILINFLNYCQSLHLEDIKLKSKRKDELYLELMCKVYNLYMEDMKDDLLNFDFVIPTFFDKEKFKINKEFIVDKKTKSYIEEDQKLEYIFKVILGSLNKKKKKAIGVFTDNTVNLFNKFVEEIEDYIQKNLNKYSERELSKAGLLDFSDYFDIQYDVDGEGNVYPDVYKEFTKPSNDKKGKKDLKFKK